MKRRDLLRVLTQNGCVLTRHGGNHDWWQNPATKTSQPVPRHNEIHEYLARSIIRALTDGRANTYPFTASGE